MIKKTMEKTVKKTAALLFTGGKDSCLSLLKSRKEYDVKYLLTIFPSSYDSWMFHKPDLKLLRAQAKALGIPLMVQKSKSVKEKELEDLEKLLSKVRGKITYVIVGGVRSSYQGKRFKRIVEKLSLKLITPLKGKEAIGIWQESIKNNFKIILTKICCEGLKKEWLNKEINKKNLRELISLSKKYGFSLEFEGGDAETAVLDMPLFKKTLSIKGKTKSEDPYRHFLLIEKVITKNK